LRSTAKTRLSHSLACAAFAALAATQTARASGFTFTQQSATASGTAGAGAARQNDAGLAWYNPAALADGGGLRLGLGLTLARPTVTADASDGSFSATAQTAWTPVPHLDLSFAFGRFAAGVSLGVPYGSAVSWPSDWPGRLQSVRSELAVGRASPFVAARIGPVRLSAGVHVDIARMQLERKLDFIDEVGAARIDLDGRGVGFDAALFWQVIDELDLGLVYRGRTALALEGGADFSVPVPLSSRAIDQRASAQLRLPDQLVLGARFHRGIWAALADFELTAWSVYDRLVVDLADPSMTDVAEDAFWETTFALRGGVEVLPTAGWVLRAGLYYDPSPVPARTLSAAVPDSSRIGVSAGASFAFSSQWNVDAFYELMLLSRRGPAALDASSVSYGGSAHFVGLGVRFAQPSGAAPAAGGAGSVTGL
jgi:long-chain fatty acid transport protein